MPQLVEFPFGLPQKSPIILMSLEQNLRNIKEASIILNQYDDINLDDLNIIFEKGGKQSAPLRT